LIDLRNESFPRGDRALSVDACAVSLLCRRLELVRAPLHLVALLSQLHERAAMRGDPLVVDSGEGCNAAHRAPEVAKSTHIKQHPRIAAAAALVNINKPHPEIRQLRFALPFERGQLLRGLLQSRLRRCHRRVGRLQLLGGDVATNLELAQIAEERSRLPRELVGFRLQGTYAFVHTSRRSVRCLRRSGRGDHDHRQQDKRAEPHHTASIESRMRVVGLDIGEKRIGVAISDLTGTLARPLSVLRPAGLDVDALEIVGREIARLAEEEDGVGAVVVGLPRRLDGTPTDMTTRVEKFAQQLHAKTSLPVTLQDERLSSREAESRLALRDKDWRSRKARLDAAAAAVILQDYLDGRA
jgi:putative pre-16S rRNA nuclease